MTDLHIDRKFLTNKPTYELEMIVEGDSNFDEQTIAWANDILEFRQEREIQEMEQFND
jgi:hypothetical protein